MAAPYPDVQRPPRSDALDALKAEAEQATALLLSFIDLIDQQIDVANTVLDDLQPPRTGKITVQWLQRRGRLLPLPVIWKKLRGGGWRYEVVSHTRLSTRVKKSRDFYDVADKVRVVVKAVSALLEQRKNAVTRLTTYKFGISGMVHGAAPVTEHYEDWLKPLREWLPKRYWEVRREQIANELGEGRSQESPSP